jgi:hypothetical protein
MTILLPAVATAFATFCIWLTVRIVNRRERWAKSMLAAVVGLAVLYVASFGPVVWATTWDGTTDLGDTGFPEPPKATVLYVPLYVISLDRKAWGHRPIRWWMLLGTPYGTIVAVPRDALVCAGLAEPAEPVK